MGSCTLTSTKEYMQRSWMNEVLLLLVVVAKVAEKREESCGLSETTTREESC